MKENNIVKLTKPITFEDKEYTELNLNFDELTGDDLENAFAEFTASGNQAFVVELSKPYLAMVAAKAANVPALVIRKLSAKDYTKVTVLAQNFLLK